MVTGDIVAFSNLWDGFHRIHYADGILVGVLFHFEITEREEAAVEFFSIKDSHIFSNVAVAFEAFHPFECRSRREVDGFGKFLYGKSGIVLKGLQYHYVGAVE